MIYLHGCSRVLLLQDLPPPVLDLDTKPCRNQNEEFSIMMQPRLMQRVSELLDRTQSLPPCTYVHVSRGIHVCSFFSDCRQGTLYGLSGKEWSNSTDITDPDQRCTAQLLSVVVRFGEVINSIQSTYRLHNGDIYEAPRIGGPGGEWEAGTWPRGIGCYIAIFGQHNHSRINPTASVINQLTFVVSDFNGDVRVFGPFGKPVTDGKYFAIGGQIGSLYGTYDQKYLRGLGAFIDYPSCVN